MSHGSEFFPVAQLKLVLVSHLDWILLHARLTKGVNHPMTLLLKEKRKGSLATMLK